MGTVRLVLSALTAGLESAGLNAQPAVSGQAATSIGARRVTLRARGIRGPNLCS